MREYPITISISTTTMVMGNSPEDAEERMRQNYKLGQLILANSIDTNGYEVEYDEGLDDNIE